MVMKNLQCSYKLKMHLQAKKLKVIFLLNSALFLDFLNSHYISLRILVPADVKSFHQFKIISYYSLNIKL